ncbi:hypothetical protein BVC80_8899g25 [Macleaya cordata]|uniref:Uncharacterized protein n=1 Tax=Macleaya cordata TaxID=56857 RepID=A0A200Q3T3_MACCD|nr:hypothetical protein BVC80_8899g25 [Macleaya cordata]
MSSSCSFTGTVPSMLKITTAKRITGGPYRGRVQLTGLNPVRANSGRIVLTGSDLVGPNMQYRPLIQSSRPITLATTRLQPVSAICAYASNAACGGTQAETVTRKSPTNVVSPFIGKEKLPQLDDGGSGINGSDLPPFYRGDDGGGGGGGGGGFAMSGGFSWGAFWFFLFLQFLKFFFTKNKESEARYRSITGKRKTIRHFLE